MLNIDQMVRSANRSGLARLDSISGAMARERREERQQIAICELTHRTKNLLAVVQAIADQIGRRSVSLKDFQTQFSRRLHGLSRSIDLLVDDGRGASIGDLVRCQLEPFGEVDGVRIAARGPVVLLNPEATQNIGLALHELATNATKYGALSVPEGVVTVNWEFGPDDVGPRCFRLIWRERNGPKVMPPTRRGFGHVILQRMTGETLQGKVNHEFEACGVSWTLEVPAYAVELRGPTANAFDAALGRNDRRLSQTSAGRVHLRASPAAMARWVEQGN